LLRHGLRLRRGVFWRWRQIFHFVRRWRNKLNFLRIFCN
jgi:hypothetical protein